MRKNRCLVLLILGILSVAALCGQDLTIFTGFQKPGTLSREVIEESISRLATANDLGGVFGLRISSSGTIGYEFGLTFSPHFVDPGLKAIHLHTNLIIQSSSRIAPYVTAGIGSLTTWGGDMLSLSDWLHFPLGNGSDPVNLGDLQSSPFKFGTRFAVNYGGGIKLRKLAGGLGARADIRVVTVPAVLGKTLNYVETTVGLMASW